MRYTGERLYEKSLTKNISQEKFCEMNIFYNKKFMGGENYNLDKYIIIPYNIITIILYPIYYYIINYYTK